MPLPKNIFKVLCLGFLLLSINFTIAQNTKESKIEKRLLQRKKLTNYLNQPYFYAGFGLGGSMHLPVSTTKVLNPDQDINIFVRNHNPFSALFQGQLFFGFQIKRHYASVRFENLTFAYGHEEGNKQTNNLRISSSFGIVPYASLSYQYDVLNNNKKISLQPGVHLGATFFSIDAYEDLRLVDGEMLRTYRYAAPKAAFAFGPSFNFEVNINRWFSLNLYQQLTYVPGPVFTSHSIFYPQQDPANSVETKMVTNFLNYSANIALRFKMYFKGTKEKVNSLP